MSTTGRHDIAVLALPGVIPFELAIPGRLFGAAVGPGGEALYDVRTCSLDGGPVPTDADYTIAVDHDAAIMRTADTVIIPASEQLGDIYDHGELSPELAEQLAAVRPGTRMVSICIAAYVLAAAGLLDGRPATTHWKQAAHFASTFPHVRVDPAVLYVDDDDVCTSAGAASGIDLCLHLIRKDHGSDVANAVARLCIVPPSRTGGQAQYIERPVPDVRDSSTQPARAWALQHLESPLTLADLAALANMSVRSFTRKFRLETGISATEWINHSRVELARHLLESSNLSIDDVAQRSGFGTSVSLRNHLRAAAGVSPSDYRRTFHPAEPPPPSAMI